VNRATIGLDSRRSSCCCASRRQAPAARGRANLVLRAPLLVLLDALQLFQSALSGGTVIVSPDFAPEHNLAFSLMVALEAAPDSAPKETASAALAVGVTAVVAPAGGRPVSPSFDSRCCPETGTKYV
jgi:hypothetical protein